MVKQTQRRKTRTTRNNKTQKHTTTRKLRSSKASSRIPANQKVYITLDNGAQPYCVTITGKVGKQTVYVKTMPKKVVEQIDDWSHPYHNMNRRQQCEYYTQNVKTYTNVKKVHIGKSSGMEYVKSADHRASHKEQFDGNSILLELGNHKVAFIGHKVFEFTVDNDEVIQKFYSVVGHSAVPYPIVRGKKYVYCMLSLEYLPREVFPQKMSEYDWEDGYGYFHGFYDTVDKSLVKKSLKKVKGLKIIHSNS